MYLLITHLDLDGIGCGVVAKTMMDEPIDILYSSNNEVDDKIIEAISKINLYKKILITDLSPRYSETTKLMQQYPKKFKLLDHHKTALELNHYSFAEVKVEVNNRLTCGTELLYIYLNDLILEKYKSNDMFNVNYNEDKLRLFVEFVRQYDTWEWKKNNLSPENSFPKMLNDLLGLVSKEEFTNSMYDSILNNRTFFPKRYLNLLETERVKREEYISNKLRQVTHLNWNGHKVGFVIADKYISELGNLICETKRVDIAVMLTENSVSMRSTDVDVSQIAKQFGGGGHLRASGFPLDKEKLFEYLFSNKE